MKVSSDDYELLLKILIRGLEEKTITIATLKDELKYNDERTKEYGEHKVDPVAFISEAMEEAEAELKPKPKAKKKKSMIETYLDEPYVKYEYKLPKKVLIELVEERGMSKSERQTFLTRQTKMKSNAAANAGISREAYEKELEKDWEEWVAEQK
jgi:hypothetical protein